MANPLVATKVSYKETVVKNITSGELFLTFLPRHGKRVAPGGEVAFRGDLDEQISPRWTQRKSDGMEHALALGLIRKTVNDHVCLYADIKSAIAVAKGDFLWYNGGTGAVEPASTFAWAGSLAATQAAFQPLFVGVAEVDHLAGSGDAQIQVQIAPTCVYEYACPSAVHQMGDYLAPAKQTGNFLENQKLDAALAADATARVLRRDAAATTTALVNLQSAYWGANAAAQQ
jgi:hypothetical protein